MAGSGRKYAFRNRASDKALEKKKDMLVRLKNIRQRESMIKDAKREIVLQTGDEYFFKMYSTYVKNGVTRRVFKPDTKKLNCNLLHINFEIRRCERKLLKSLCRPEGTHIRYRSGLEERYKCCDDDSPIDYAKSEMKKKAYLEYIEKLKECRAEIVKHLKA